MSDEVFDDEVDYLAYYKTEHVYVHPAAAGTGADVKLLAQDEELLFGSEIAERCRIAVTLFYKNERRDFTSLTLSRAQRARSPRPVPQLLTANTNLSDTPLSATARRMSHEKASFAVAKSSLNAN